MADKKDLIQHYNCREISQLQFNLRVVMQGADKSTPVLERLRFLCIASRNLDEFFEVRVAALHQLVKYGTEAQSGEGLTAQEILAEISKQAHSIVKLQYRLLQKSVLTALRKRDIYFLRRHEWDKAQRQWIRQYFRRNILPILSPLGLDSRHPFPRVQNKSLNFMVKLAGKDAYGRSTEYAVVTAPRSLPRIVRLPDEVGNKRDSYVFLSSIIHDNLEDLFPGLKLKGCHQFRVTMDSNLFYDEEEVESLRDVLAGMLPERQYGEAVRLEVVNDCPRDIIRFLREQYQLDADSVYEVNGPVNLYRLMNFPELIDRPDLRYPPYRPKTPQTFKLLPTSGSLFDLLDRQDVLLHHPFNSFKWTIRFLREAAADPKVVAIKQTIYRTGLESDLTDILESAARSGKEVTVIIELSARFDEEANIQLAQRLEQAGAQVLYGVVGHKTHAKMMLVVRQSDDGLRRYAHLGTGNYHPVTTRLYTDYALLTSNQDLCEDVHKIFLQVASLGRAPKLSLMYQSPLTLGQGLIKKILAAAEQARKGETAIIYAKMNALTEYGIIDALYEASQAGVTIDLLVRGECRLRPGVKGLSDNIRVRSIVGRFLEHTRVFYFRTGENEEMYLSSADWMTRNIHRRVETMFPVLDESIKKRIMREIFETYFADNCQSWQMEPDGTYTKTPIGRGHKRFAAQEALMAMHGEIDESYL
ncbi:MAG: polyphosphate kinase 1 [Gammaproteobacteria bacterium]|nr:polyphosphate kinase 1 [Gammaproteobacteria bacterium]MDE0611304.1 polyphosphate kinase 1 [Gammaproteobacteria bacterium]